MGSSRYWSSRSSWCSRFCRSSRVLVAAVSASTAFACHPLMAFATGSIWTLRSIMPIIGNFLTDSTFLLLVWRRRLLFAWTRSAWLSSWLLSLFTSNDCSTLSLQRNIRDQVLLSVTHESFAETDLNDWPLPCGNYHIGRYLVGTSVLLPPSGV